MRPGDVLLGSHARVLRALVPALARLHLRLVLLLPLHPPVLEPDLDLPLRQTESVSDLYPPTASEISVEVELLLQLQGLVSGVGLPASLPF